MEKEYNQKVSVVIPAYNNYSSFEKTLNSVLEQEYKDYEVIITDDSSEDKIKNFVESLNHPKIKYFKNEKTLGVPENWNKGLKIASGEYIKIMHHDDWFENPQSLGKFVKLLDENPNSDFGYSKSVDVDLKSGKIKTRKAEKYVEILQDNCFELFFNNRIGAPSVTIFRNKEDIFFDKNLTWVVDIDFYIQWLMKTNAKTKGAIFINEVLVNIGISNSQVSKSCLNNRYIEVFEQIYLYNKYKSFLSDKKYIKYLKKMLKTFNIKNRDDLKKILPATTEIPEELFSKKIFGIF